MELAHSKRLAKDEARLDAEFHLSIIEASHNVIMLHMMRSMYQLLQEGVFYNRRMMFKQRTTQDEFLAQHHTIYAALQRRPTTRDFAGAQTAVESHLNYVRDCLEDQNRATLNEDYAQLRFDHEQTRQ